MNELAKTFEYNFEGHNVRTMTDDEGNPWFVLADVCAVLEISNPSQAATRLDDDEKSTLTNNEGRPGSGAQQFTIINESGLYSLILTSRKPEAKRFKKWVTAEVLPSIRKTGIYAPDVSSVDFLLLCAQRLVAQEKRQKELEARQKQAEATAQQAVEIAKIAEAKAQATAMACQDFSVMAYSRLREMPIDLGTANALGKECARISRERGFPIGKTRDPRFGSINTYIESVLEEVFGRYISEVDL